jgi:hypothetical protein
LKTLRNSPDSSAFFIDQKTGWVTTESQDDEGRCAKIFFEISWPASRAGRECSPETLSHKRADAIARFDVGSLWKHVATHLLADGCQHRTGRHEEDGCWPEFS